MLRATPCRPARYRSIVLSIFLFIVTASVARSQPIVPDPDAVPIASGLLAITDARIVVRPGEVIDRGTVLVRDGLIAAVGRSVDLPKGTRTIDGRSMTVYAGFIDGHSHAGVAPEKDPEGKVERSGDPPPERAGMMPERDVRDLYDRTASSVDSLRRAGFGLAHVVPRRGFLAGQGGLMLLGGRDTARLTFKPAVSLVTSFDGANDAYPATPMGIIASLRTLFRQAALLSDHRTSFGRDAFGLSRPTDDRIREHLIPSLLGERPLFFAVEDGLEVRRAMVLADELDLPLIIAGLRQSNDILDLIARRKTPVFLSLAFPDKVEDEEERTRKKSDTLEEEDLPEGDSTTRPVPTTLESYRIGQGRTEDFGGVAGEYLRLVHVRDASRRASLRLPALAAEKRIRFGFGTAGIGTNQVTRRIREAVAAGLTEDRALAALTTDAAALLGISASFGSVETGKVANLVVARGSIFSDTGQVAMTIIDGEPFDYRSDLADEEEDSDDESGRFGGWKKKRKTTDEIRTLVATNAVEPQMPGRAVALRRDSSGTILVKGATLLTGTDRGDLENTDILVEKGKIVRIGENLSAPSGARTVDATGHFVMPGIIDAHSHIAVSGPVNEWTSPVTAEVKIGDVIDPYDITIYRALAGGVTTSHVMHGSANPIGGECETIKHRYGEVDPERMKMEGAPRTIKFALGENPTRVHGRGYDVPPSTRMGVEQTFRKAFTDAERYMREWEEWNETSADERKRRVPPVYTERLETLAAILRGEILVHCHSYRADEIVMLLGVLRDFGVEKITFQHANEGFKVAKELAAYGAAASVFSDWWAYKFEVYYSTAYNAAILTRNNVVTSINSDSPELNRHLYHEAAKSMRYGGLTADEALAMITINPARQLGIDDRVGTLEVGKEGDLAIFEGHPLSIYAKPRMTIVDGVVRFDAVEDPDDMRLYVDPEEDLARTIEEVEDQCMQMEDDR